MVKKLSIVLGVLLVLGVVGGLVYGPIQREAMKVPLVRALDGVNGGDLAAVRAQVTPGAMAVSREHSVAISRLLEIAEKHITPGRSESPLRFGGYHDLQWEGDRATAKATIIVDYTGDDNPYRNIPLRLTIDLTLRRAGWFTWKIDAVSSDSPWFEGVVGEF